MLLQLLAEVAEVRKVIGDLQAELEPWRPLLARLRPAGGRPAADMLSVIQTARDVRRAGRHGR